MLQLPEKMRNEIVQTLQAQVVPAGSGSVLMQIAQILSQLQVVEEKKEPVEDAQQAPEPKKDEKTS